MTCINTKHPAFLALLKDTGLRPFQLELRVVAWQMANDTDVFPTKEQLGISYQKDSEINKEVLGLLKNTLKPILLPN